MKKIRLLFLMILLLAYTNILYAQQNKTDDKPGWIRMMNDSTVNYFTAVKAFNDFWKGKEKPVEEDETFAANAKKEKRRSPKEKDAEKYAFEYKKFLNWQRSVLPYVQPDGRILTPQQRLKIFYEEKKKNEAAGSN